MHRLTRLIQVVHLLTPLACCLCVGSIAAAQVRINTDEPEQRRPRPISTPAAVPLSAEAAARFFDMAKERAYEDAGKLWGVKLWGPLLIADPASRAVIANKRDRDGELRREGDLWVGTLPAHVNIFNTLAYWADEIWACVTWPLMGDDASGTALMLHELFHRVQPEINLPQRSPACLHLDAMSGRLYLRLEMRALQAAVVAEGEAREQARRDALIFRAMRRSLFNPQTAEQEAVLELNEGLAEYTGLKLCGVDETERNRRAHQFIRAKEHDVSLMRSFSYGTGLAYALLLDEAKPAWRESLNQKSDLGEMLRTAASITLPRDLAQAAQEAGERYEVSSLTEMEAAREADRAPVLVERRARLIDGPVLEVAFASNSRIVFDQHTMGALGGLQYLHQCRVADEWGVLIVSNGAILDEGRSPKVVRVGAGELDREAMSQRVIKGEGWTLELAEGWRVAPARSRGNWVVRRE